MAENVIQPHLFPATSEMYQMIRDSLNNSLDSVSKTRQRLETQLRPKLDWASAELRKVLKEMGADISEPSSLSSVLKDIRASNPTFRDLALRFDVATYDLRKKLLWDANMVTAYVTDKAGQTYSTEVRPRFEEVRNRAESRARSVMAQVRELTAKNNADT